MDVPWMKNGCLTDNFLNPGSVDPCMARESFSLKIDKGIAAFIQQCIDAHAELGYHPVRAFVEETSLDEIKRIQEQQKATN